MLKKSTLWLCLLLISALAMPAWSLPKSMIMTMKISSKQGARPVNADAKLWYANNKFRLEITSNMNMSQTNTPVRINNRATMVVDTKTKVGFMIDDSTRTAIRADQNTLNKLSPGGSRTSLTDPTAFTDPAKIKAEIKRQGGKEVGKATILGHACTIWQMSTQQKVPVGQGKMETQTVTSKLWFAESVGLPLKVEVNSAKLGNIVSMNVTGIQVNVPVNNSLFGVPAGYKVQNFDDLYKAPR